MTDPFRDVAGRPSGPLTGDAWNERWLEDNTPWDMGYASPPFERALRDGLVPTGGRVLVPGCGSGHEARMLGRLGFNVTAIDLAPKALEKAQSLTSAEDGQIRFVQADLLALPDQISELDLVLEHTCFCAIDPGLRDDYVRAVADALRPGGRLLGLFFLIETEEGPPFGATREEIEHRFSKRFSIDHFEMPRDSHEKRLDREALFVMTRT